MKKLFVVFMCLFLFTGCSVDHQQEMVTSKVKEPSK